MEEKNGKDSKCDYNKLETFTSFLSRVRSLEDIESYFKVNRARHMPQNHFMVASQDTDL